MWEAAVAQMEEVRASCARVLGFDPDVRLIPLRDLDCAGEAFILPAAFDFGLCDRELLGPRIAEHRRDHPDCVIDVYKRQVQRMRLKSVESTRSASVKSIPFVTLAQYSGVCLGLGTIRLGGLGGSGNWLLYRIAAGVAVKLHGLGEVLKISAMGAASASFKFIICGRPRL